MDINILNTVLETERLILRPWRENDLEDLFEYASVFGVGEMAGWKSHKSREESRKILKVFIEEKNVLAVELKENKKVIGSVAIHESGWAKNDECYSNIKLKEMGYILSKDYWGRGLMPEAAAAVIDYYFTECGFDVLSCCYCGENNQSKRVIEKCGFSFLKQGEYYSEELEKTLPDMIYVLAKETWNAGRKNNGLKRRESQQTAL